MRHLTLRQRHKAHQDYHQQWLDGILQDYEYIAREGILNVHNRTWEGLSMDKQFEAIVMAQKALSDAREQLDHDSLGQVPGITLDSRESCLG